MISDEEYQKLHERLSRSAFRSRFHLKERERAYVLEKGMDTIERHAYDFIISRLAPEDIPNDGKQTPMKGHPVFIAQHATALCCRGCAEKWHKISKGRKMTESEIDYAVSVIMHYIRDEMASGR